MFMPGTIRPGYGFAPPGKVTGPDRDTLAILRRMTKRCIGKSQVNVPFQQVRFVVLDLETTGFEADNGDEVISLAAVVLQNGNIHLQSALNMLVDPLRPIPENISVLTGIRNDMVAGKPLVYKAVIEFMNLLGDGVIAGHALGFDLGFLNYKLSRVKAGRIQSLIFDTKIVARHLFPALADYSLDHLLKLCGIKDVGRHSALGDCLLTAELLSHQLAELQQRGISNLAKLYQCLEKHKSSCSF